MAIQNITELFNNQQKRYAEAVVVTIPSILKAGGGRSQAEPRLSQYISKEETP